MKPSFKRNQKWTTRDGRLAVIDTVRGDQEEYPIQGRCRLKNGNWSQREWTAQGSYYEDGRTHEVDLIDPWPKEREPREYWVVLYKSKCPLMFEKEQEAYDHGYSTMADGCIKVREILE